MRITLLAILSLFIGKGYSQINEDYLKIGEHAPRIIGVDQNGKNIDSELILKENRILLFFYRGNWCPYCKKHLLELQDRLEEINEKGIVVIVVTPENEEKIIETTTKFKVSYSILHDVNNVIMNNYKVAFDVVEENIPKYFKFTKGKVEMYNSENVLPVPATYLIGKKKTIEYVHYDPDYTKRSNFDDILNKHDKYHLGK